MVVKPFSQKIDPEKLFEIQNSQYTDRLVLADTVPAGSTKLGKVNVSNLGHFFCMFVTGMFTTSTLFQAAHRDTGGEYLSGQLIDGAGQRKLFNDRIPFGLWLSPGRRKDMSVANAANILTDPIANNLFYPIELEYLFTANSDILLDVANTGLVENSYEIEFHGIRIISDMVVRNRINSGATGTNLSRAKIQPFRRG